MDKPLALLHGEALPNRNDSHVIYAHSNRSRLFVLFIFGSYLVIFTMFSMFVKNKLGELAHTPPVFFDDPRTTMLIYYSLAGLIWLISVALLVYFAWWVVEIWGLQVWVSDREIRVKNTILGGHLRRYTGVGHMMMEDILELRSSSFHTYLSSVGGRVRFSPVENLEMLIATVIANAPHARISS